MGEPHSIERYERARRPPTPEAPQRKRREDRRRPKRARTARPRTATYRAGARNPDEAPVPKTPRTSSPGTADTGYLNRNCWSGPSSGPAPPFWKKANRPDRSRLGRIAALIRASSSAGAPSMPIRIRVVAGPVRASSSMKRATSVSPLGQKIRHVGPDVDQREGEREITAAAASASAIGRARRAPPWSPLRRGHRRGRRTGFRDRRAQGAGRTLIREVSPFA